MIEIDIRPLCVEDISPLAQLLAEQRPEYMQSFFPFAFDARSLQKLIKEAEADCYWTLRWQGELAGFFMLRGFDEGYKRPSFGVFVAEAFAGRGISMAGLEYALDWCRGKGVMEVMLKVDPENKRALAVYQKAGFITAGKCPDTGHDIMIRKEAE